MKKILYAILFIFTLTHLVRCEIFRSPYGRLTPVYSVQGKIISTNPYSKKKSEISKPKQSRSKPKKQAIAIKKTEKKVFIANKKQVSKKKNIEQIINEEQAKEADFFLTKEETEKRIKELDRLIETDKRREFLSRITFGLFEY